MKTKKGTKCKQGKKIPEKCTSTGTAAGKGKCKRGANHFCFVSRFKTCNFCPFILLLTKLNLPKL